MKTKYVKVIFVAITGILIIGYILEWTWVAYFGTLIAFFLLFWGILDRGERHLKARREKETTYKHRNMNKL